MPPARSRCLDLVTLRAAPTLVFLALANVAAVVLSANLMGRRALALAKAERRLFAHAWHLRQFVPDRARDAAVEPGKRQASIRPRA